jgi:glycerophosphoryl diester phosphodiesterase
MLVIAHAGARSLAPENTLAAARKALEVGADMWELDVGVTADSELILFHDDSLARTTDARRMYPDRAPWTFTTFTLSELEVLDSGTWFVETDPFGQIAAGAVTSQEQANYRGEPVPTLRRALEFTRDNHWRVNVEIKTLPPPMTDFPVVEAVISLINELDMASQVLVSSFVPDHVMQVRRLNPSIATAAVVGWSQTEALHMPLDLPVDGYNPRHTLLSDQQIQGLRQTGFEVHPWTVNEEAEMRRLIRAGVTGIITDFPQRLRQVLAAQKTAAVSMKKVN